MRNFKYIKKEWWWYKELMFSLFDIIVFLSSYLKSKVINRWNGMNDLLSNTLAEEKAVWESRLKERMAEHC